MATYYAFTTGNDSNSGTSVGSPKRTINAGIALLSAGDTLLLRGIFDEGIENSVPSGTSWSNKVRIAAYPGETVWLKPLVAFVGNNGFVIEFTTTRQYIEFDGINLDATFMPYIAVHFDNFGGANPNHIRMQNAEIIAGPTGGAGTVTIASNDNEFIRLTVHGGGIPGGCGILCTNYAFYLGGSRNLVEYCDIYDTTTAGVQIFNGGGGSADNNIVRYNRIHDITKSGDVRLWGVIVVGNNNEVHTNLIYRLNFPYGSSNAGVYVFHGIGTKIYGNTIYDCTTDGIYLNSSSVSATDVRNNIVFSVSGDNFVDGGAGTVADHNLLGTDPLFVNAGAGDFRLQAGSPAIDAGATIATIATDIVGTLRPKGAAYDIGAYEYTTTVSPPAAPTGLHIV